MSLRILHTADWHLGKRLHSADLRKEHLLFFEDLLSIIREREITHLLIAGDVFDHANPSNEALELYYTFIRKLLDTRCALIVTGGNHDSPGVLNAPQSLLKQLRVSVIGCATENPEDEIVELKNSSNQTEAVLAAVPFLRDRDIRRSSEGENYKDRIQAIREGIKEHYFQLAEICKTNYPGVPAIASGHLYVQGAETSESEREIQIGNQAGVEENTFPEYFAYVALGHIHKAQNVGKSGRIRYSGSPVALSFQEKSYKKRVVLIHVENQQVNTEEIELKKHRDLIVLEGSIESIKKKYASYINSFTLPAFVELNVIESVYDPLLIREKELLSNELEQNNSVEVLVSKIQFLSTEKNETDISFTSEDSEELQPLSILKSRINEYPEEEQIELENTLLSLVEELREKGLLP